MKLASTLALAYVLLSSGSAAAFNGSTHCYGAGRSFSCYSTFGYRPRGNVLTVTPEDTAEALARDAKWQEYCKPVLGEPDKLGMRRYVYAKPGCENGRSED